MVSQERYDTAEDVLAARFQDEGSDFDNDLCFSNEGEGLGEDNIMTNENSRSKPWRSTLVKKAITTTRIVL